MREVRNRIRTFGPTELPVLTIGETGTGKELAARAVASHGHADPFVAANCAAIPDSLMEAHLFGSVRGAFTGASRDRPGLIAQADGGSLFLDELSDASPALQAALLRTLDSGEFQAVGSDRVRYSEFRLIAATNADVERLREEGRLRADLLHRLGAYRIHLPPLRDRRDDILLLAEHFLAGRRAGAEGRAPTRFSGTAMGYLTAQEWPGNVRELKHVVEAATALAGSADAVEMEHLAYVSPPGRGKSRSPPSPRLALRASVAPSRPRSDGPPVMRRQRHGSSGYPDRPTIGYARSTSARSEQALPVRGKNPSLTFETGRKTHERRRPARADATPDTGRQGRGVPILRIRRMPPRRPRKADPLSP